MIVTIDKQKIEYEILGEGEPAICLHGILLDKEMLKNKTFLESFPNKQLILVNLPGFGESTMLKHLSFYELNKTINKFTDYLELEQFELIGFCLGGDIAFDYSIKYPHRVKKLTLIETMIYFPNWLNIFFVPNVEKFYYSLVKTDFFKNYLINNPYFGANSENSIVFDGFAKADFKYNLEYLKMVKKYSKLNHLNRIKESIIPLEIMMAEYSAPEIQRTTKSLLIVRPDTTVKRIEGCGHLMNS